MDITDKILRNYNAINIINTKENVFPNETRHAYFCTRLDGSKIVIKAARNTYTTPERVAGWAKIAEHYNSIGIYTPSFLRNTSGDYSSIENDYCVYAEEFADGDLRNWNDTYSHRNKALETIGIAAANPAFTVPWKTAYCLFETFSDEENIDERLENAMGFAKHISEKYPELSGRADALLKKHIKQRAEFEMLYSTLPKSIFQGDLSLSNIVYTKNGDFKGLIDFNLSGTEIILNYMFCECMLTPAGSLEPFSEKRDIQRDEQISKNIACARKYYALTDMEKFAFNQYYQIAFPFLGGGDYTFALETKNAEQASLALDWLERHMSRANAAELLG